MANRVADSVAATAARIASIMGSAAGDAARALFDHGRRGDVFGGWLPAE
jgi:hypothetical protein